MVFNSFYLKFDVSNPKFDVRHVKLDVSNLKFDIDNLKLDVRYFKFGVINVKHGLSKVKYGITNAKFEVFTKSMNNLQFTIHNYLHLSLRGGTTKQSVVANVKLMRLLLEKLVMTDGAQ